MLGLHSVLASPKAKVFPDSLEAIICQIQQDWNELTNELTVATPKAISINTKAFYCRISEI